jgi:hypothetical protein
MSIKRCLEKFPWHCEDAALDAALKAVRDAGRRRGERILTEPDFFSRACFEELRVLGMEIQGVEKFIASTEISTKNYINFGEFISACFEVKRRVLEVASGDSRQRVLDTLKARMFQRMERLFSGRLYPDMQTLEVFKQDFEMFERLFDRDPMYLEKFRTNAYLVCVGKRLEVDGGNTANAIFRLWREFHLDWIFGDFLRKSLELINSCNAVGELETLIPLKNDIWGEISARTRPELKKDVQDLFDRSMSRVERLVEQQLITECAEIVTKVCAQLEGVKQVPTLYRMTTKSFPTRCSAYVDATLKVWRSLADQTRSASVRKQAGSEILKNFRCIIDDLEKSTTDDKTRAQLALDWTHVSEALDRYF